MSRFLKVKDKKHLYRDTESNCIINSDHNGLKRAKELKARLNSREETIKELTQDVAQLKDLVKQLLEERNGDS